MPRLMVKPKGYVFRYAFSGSSVKHYCPHCHKKTYSRYVDVTTGNYLDYQYGRCDREIKCKYHVKPHYDSYIKENKALPYFKNHENIPPSFIDREQALVTLNNGDSCLIQYLKKYFDPKLVETISKRYGIGTDHSIWKNSTVFWQIDKDKRIRTGKIMLYDSDTGKRVKHPSRISWLHKLPLYNNKKEYNLKQVFFGEHLLRSRVKRFHIVESEKTALIMSLIYPKKAILATGGIQNINLERLLPFKDKILYFYPDNGDAVNVWGRKLKPYKNFNITVFKTINYLPGLKEGEDIADYYLKKKKIPPFN